MQGYFKKIVWWTQSLRCLWFLLFAVAMSVGSAGNAYSASKTLLVLGDSLSAEYGLARGAGWVALLESRLKALNYQVNVINSSVSGETTSGGKTRLPALLEKHRPDIVVIELGANDGLRGLPLTATEANIMVMIAASQRARTKVLLIGMQLPPNYGRAYTEKFSAMFPGISKKTGASLAPFLLEGIADQPQLFQADRIHPNAQAHPIMLDNIWPNLKPLLK